MTTDPLIGSVESDRRQRQTGTTAADAGTGGFVRRWVAWTSAGETAGFAVAAVVGALTATSDLPGGAEFALLVGAGSIEGALLGTGQAIALSRLQLSRGIVRRWPVVTGVAAALAWIIGLLLFSGSIPGMDWESPLAWLLAAILGAVLLLSIPMAQYLLLRTAIPRASRWIWVNVLAWLLGLSWTFAPSPVVDASTPTSALILIYIVAGLLMAITVAVITGLCWLRWLRRGVVRIAEGT